MKTPHQPGYTFELTDDWRYADVIEAERQIADEVSRNGFVSASGGSCGSIEEFGYCAVASKPGWYPPSDAVARGQRKVPRARDLVTINLPGLGNPTAVYVVSKIYGYKVKCPQSGRWVKVANVYDPAHGVMLRNVPANYLTRV